jgi:hypothetical protein
MEISIMAHFAELNTDNIVLRVLVVANDMIKDEQGNEQEQTGIDFLKSLFGSETIWKQTSYNGNIRKNYAVIGHTYDVTRNAFIAPQPPAFANGDVWELNEETCRWFDPKAPVGGAAIGVSRV